MKILPLYHNVFIETSLSRILKSISINTSFVVISTHQFGFEKEKNETHHADLINDLQNSRFGFAIQKARYTRYDKRNKVESRVEEESLFITNLDEKIALNIGIKYGQNTILYKDKEKFVLLNCEDGSVNDNFQMKLNVNVLDFDPSVLKMAFCQLIKSNKPKQSRYAIKAVEQIYEFRIPSWADSIRSIGTGKLAETRWIRYI